MAIEIKQLINLFSETPGNEFVLSELVTDLILPKMTKLDQGEIDIIYLTIITFHPRSKLHGTILIKKMVQIGLIEKQKISTELEDPLTPDWVKEVFLKG